MRMVKGLSHAGAERMVAACAARPFSDIADLALRAALNQRDLQCLAQAGALRSLSAHRHHAHWQAAGVDTVRQSLPRWQFAADQGLQLTPPSESAEVVTDYASLGLTLGRHPLALLRPRLAGSLTALELQAKPHGSFARVTGLVTGRQRPGTASGIIFVTLEDETGNLNVVVRARLADRQRRELLGSRLLTVQGLVERAGSTVHLVARTLADRSILLGELASRSRDFH
jgi:error-prone DNA polymerase